MVKCPQCGSKHVAPIMYGLPTYEGFEVSAKEEVILGGCEVYEGQPDYGCFDCNFQWSKGSLPKEAITKIRFKVIENGPCFIDDMHRWVYEVYPKGKTAKYAYIGRNRKYVEKEVQLVPEHKILDLYEKLQTLVSTDWSEEIVCHVCDGCSYELQILYIDGRKEFHDGDVGGGTVDVLLMTFLNDVFLEEV